VQTRRRCLVRRGRPIRRQPRVAVSLAPGGRERAGRTRWRGPASVEKASNSKKILADGDLSELFGLDIDDAAATPARRRAPARTRKPKVKLKPRPSECPGAASARSADTAVKAIQIGEKKISVTRMRRYSASRTQSSTFRSVLCHVIQSTYLTVASQALICVYPHEPRSGSLRQQAKPAGKFPRGIRCGSRETAKLDVVIAAPRR